MSVSILLRNNLFFLLLLFIYSDIQNIVYNRLPSIRLLSSSTLLRTSTNILSSSSSSLLSSVVYEDVVKNNVNAIDTLIRFPFYVEGAPVLSNRKNNNNNNHQVGINTGRNSGKAKSSTHAVWKQIKNDCERTPACQKLPMHTEENCLLQCQAPGCYKAIYAENPLEPGEIDSKRAATYSRCLKEFENRLRKNNAWPPIISSITGSVEEPLLPSPSSNELSDSSTSTSVENKVDNINDNNQPVTTITATSKDTTDTNRNANSVHNDEKPVSPSSLTEEGEEKSIIPSSPSSLLYASATPSFGSFEESITSRNG